ncbi:hypothetical protein FA15DRAFT_756744 [Coprinopsis marcescibilis]|uniref:Proteasome assembly chaperone 1 n=1 Tax=Coprinopsis marcescibilis TaxID=230819 RepID=A0A5C3KTZ8_COPMA|nr:hypothetical protein FA15DRAFT_756744 [Coprinopsis marcescibilis]
MNTDPLQDSLPPRYAVESDEEDELNPLEHRVREPTKVDISIQGNIEKGGSLVVANTEIGAFWAKGAHLGEQTAAIMVNKIQVGLVFTPAWTRSTIIVSESFTRLPLSFMYPYAQKIIEALEPTQVSILDVYSVPIYTSQNPQRIHDAPLRYLCTTESPVASELPLFEPPNLLQTTSAAILSISSLQSVPVTAILVPLAHVPRPAPKELLPTHFLLSSEIPDQWTSSTLEDAHRFLLFALQEHSTEPWHLKGSELERLTSSRTRRTEIGEGGMYL